MHIIGSLDRGGAETFLMNVLRNIGDYNVNFIFLCYGNSAFDYEEEALGLGAKIIRVPDVKEAGMVKHLRDLKRTMKDNQVDVVHAHTYYNSVFSLIAAKLANITVRVVHSHSTQSETNPSLTKRLYFTASKLGISLFANRFLACGDEAGKALFYKKHHFTVIHNGIDIESFAYSKKARDHVRQELNISNDATIIMHAGRFAEVKNHQFIIDIFDKYLKLDINSKLILVGDGPLRPSIQQLVKERKMTNDVIFLGKRSDMSRLYSSADLFLFPSLFEGLPVVLIEAQASGIKSFVSDTVDRSVRLTDTIQFLSLAKSSTYWAREMFNSDKHHIETTGQLLSGEYSIPNVVNDLLKTYEVEPSR